MLTALALLPFREVPFARNEESILEKDRNEGVPERGRYSFPSKPFVTSFVLHVIAHRRESIDYSRLYIV